MRCARGRCPKTGHRLSAVTRLQVALDPFVQQLPAGDVVGLGGSNCAARFLGRQSNRVTLFALNLTAFLHP